MIFRGVVDRILEVQMKKLLKGAALVVSLLGCGDDSAPPAPDCAHDKALCDDGPPDVSVTPSGNANDKHGPQGAATVHWGSVQNVSAMQVDYCGNTPCWRRKYPVVYQAWKKDLNQSGRTRFLQTVSWTFGWSQLQAWTNYPTAVWLCVGEGDCVDITNQSMAGGLRSGTTDVSWMGWSWPSGSAIYFHIDVSFGDWGQVSPPKYWVDGVVDGFTYTDGPN